VQQVNINKQKEKMQLISKFEGNNYEMLISDFVKLFDLSSKNRKQQMLNIELMCMEISNEFNIVCFVEFSRRTIIFQKKQYDM